MKYRVKIDLAFDSESDARSLMTSASELLPRAGSINPGAPDAEGGFCELEICRHDESASGGCTRLEVS